MNKILNSSKIIGIFSLLVSFQALIFSQLSFSQPKTNNTDIENINNKPDSIIHVYPLQNIYFDFDSNTLRTVDLQNLEQIVLLLKQYPDLILEIKGHTDNQEMQSLSTKRSQTVYEWFLIQGIEKQRIKYKGMGATYPIVSNNYPENRQLNRRIEFNVIK